MCDFHIRIMYMKQKKIQHIMWVNISIWGIGKFLLISMFVKLVSRKQCLIPHFESQETDSRAEMVGVFLAHVCGLVSDWLGNQVQKPIF